jgi:hypothetical protein
MGSVGGTGNRKEKVIALPDLFLCPPRSPWLLQYIQLQITLVHTRRRYV